MGYEVIRFDEWFRDKRDEKKNRRKSQKFGKGASTKQNSTKH